MKTKKDLEQSRCQIVGDDKIMERWREAQLLFNLLEPDPAFQPIYVSDMASLLDCLGADDDEMLATLRRYFGPSFQSTLTMPVWKVIDEIRLQFPGWPEGEWKATK